MTGLETRRIQKKIKKMGSNRYSMNSGKAVRRLFSVIPAAVEVTPFLHPQEQVPGQMSAAKNCYARLSSATTAFDKFSFAWRSTSAEKHPDV